MNENLVGIANAAPAIAMLACFASIAGGIWQWRRGDRQKGLLMLGVAVVLFANVLIWTM